MAKKRRKAGKAVQKKVNAGKNKPAGKKQSNESFFPELLDEDTKPKSEYRKKEEDDLRSAEHRLSDLAAERHMEKTATTQVPSWFYMSSIFAVFLFTAYISIFATIHFESIEYMNMMIIFLFIAMVSYFLISAIYFISEKKKWHAVAPILFFIGIVSIMVYAFKAVDTSNLVRYSIIYAIIVAAVSAYVLAIKK